MIVAFAGRRIDTADTPHAAFPAGNIEAVRRRLRTFYETNRPLAVVGSAACGADLLAHQEAGALGIRCRVVLPFEPGRFRETSVVDRPGDWGSIYDHLIAETQARADLVIVQSSAEEMEAYARTNVLILDQAAALARQAASSVTAVLIWEGPRQGAEDLTDAFGEEARKRGFPVVELDTL